MSPFLKKSFDSAKCKTVLQLTGQKLKILRNKHGLAVKSLRTNVAMLLEKGQDTNAKTQAESVFREEKIVALYTLLEQYCQLVISHLESIKSQRECPSDLIEAIASLIYSASRCGEIEELKKLSRYFTNKYGTEFSLAAKELRSGCGVNTQVIQNLSSLPPSSDARMKLLKDVAVEFKINWDYDPNIVDTSKQPADSQDGPNHSISGTQASNLSCVEIQRPASTSKQVNDVNGQASGVLKTAFSSHTTSPKTSVDSTFHKMHQPAKDNPNLESKEFCSSSRAKSHPVSTLDPYALAKSQGRMDYKFVSEHEGREHMIEEHLTSTKSVKVMQSSGQLRSPGSPKVPCAKQMSTEGRQEMETQLLELEIAAKIALESAAEAAEAAKAAVAMVRKESLEKTKKPEGKISLSSSASVLDESSLCSVRDVSQFSPSLNKSGSDFISNKYILQDAQQSSGSQRRSSQIKYSAKLNTTVSVWEEERSTEVTESPLIESFYSTDVKEEEVNSKTQEEEGFFIEKTVWQDKTVQNFSSVPQFDDHSTDEALEEETPFLAYKNASSKQQDGHVFDVVEVQSDNNRQQGWSVPQFDDDVCEEASEEETPFYLKGRAAMVKEDYADGMARAPSSKLISSSPLTDGMVEGSSTTNLEGIKEQVNMHQDHQKEPSNPSTNMGKVNFMQERSVHSLELPASENIKNYSRSQVDAMNGGPGTRRSYLDLSNDSSPSPLIAVTPFLPNGGLSDSEEDNSSNRVRRSLKLSSSISKDTDFVSVSSTLSYKPSSLEDTSLKSPDSALGLENIPRASKPELELRSPTKYQGMSRRSVRSSRPRQPENKPSPMA